MATKNDVKKLMAITLIQFTLSPTEVVRKLVLKILDYIETVANTLVTSAKIAAGAVTPGKLGAATLEQTPDWADIFGGGGLYIFKDDAQGENRPVGIPIPTDEEVFTYNIITLGGTTNNAALVVGEEDGAVYLITKAGAVLTATTFSLT